MIKWLRTSLCFLRSVPRDARSRGHFTPMHTSFSMSSRIS